jgi:hypothetical protein
VSRRPGKEGVGVVGIGVAACAACCAGPILGFVAATGLFTVARVAAFGAAGLLVLAGVWWHRRHRRAAACAAADEPVPVEMGRRP